MGCNANAIFEKLKECEELIKYLKKDKTLELLLTNDGVDGRSGHAWIYYRGMGLMNLRISRGELVADVHNLPDKEPDEAAVGRSGKRRAVKKPKYKKMSLSDAVESIPLLKKKLDFHERGHHLEKEAMQKLAGENNFDHREGKNTVNQSIALRTDYYIADMETGFTYGRFDGLGVYWPSRRQGRDCKLALIEAKYGSGVIGDGKTVKDATVSGHIRDMYKYFCAGGDAEIKLADLFVRAKDALTKKQELGLISISRGVRFEKINRIGTEQEYILVIMNNTPAAMATFYKELTQAKSLPVESDSGKLMYEELKKLGFSFLIAQSSFMGYGLYRDCMITWESWIEEYEKKHLTP